MSLKLEVLGVGLINKIGQISCLAKFRFSKSFSRHAFTLSIFGVLLNVFAPSLYASDPTADIQGVISAAANSTYNVGVDSYTFGAGNDLTLTGVTGVSGLQYNLAPVTSRVEIRTVDNDSVTGGPRSRIYVENSDGFNDPSPYNFVGSFPGAPGALSSEEVLGGNIINRGVLDVFLNDDQGSAELAGNIERVDYIYDAGITTPSTAALLNEGGHIYIEKSANNPAQIAAITSLDALGNPLTYGTLFPIGTSLIQTANINGVDNRFVWTFLFDQAPVGINYTLGANPSRTRDSRERIGGAVITFNDLGLSPNQTYYGISYFDGSVVDGPQNLVTLTGFDTDTTGPNGGADFGGGLGGLLLTDDAASNPTIKTVKAVSTATPPLNNGDGTFNVTYELVVQNTGGIILDNLVFTDVPNADLLAATVSTVTQPTLGASTATANPTLGTYPSLFTGGTIAPGQSVAVSYVLQVNPALAADPTAMTNQASVTAEDPAGVAGTVVAMDLSDSGTDPTNDNPGAPGDGTGPNTNDDPTPLILAAIKTVKAVSTATPPLNNGDGTFNVTYELVVQNTGGIILDNLVFTDVPNADLLAATVSTVTQPTLGASTATANPTLGTYPSLFTGGTIAPGQSVAVSYVLQVNPALAADPTAMTNQASVTAEDPAGVAGTVVAMDLSDSGTDPTNDNPGAPGDGTGPNTNDDPTPLILAAIKTVKAVSTATPPLNNGDGTFNVTYELVVQNTGGIILDNLVFTDVPNADLLAATVSTVTQPTLGASTATANPTLGTYPSLFTGGTIAPGQSVAVSYVLQVNPALAADPTAMTNQASVTAEDPAGVAGTVVAMDLSDSGIDPTNDNPGAPGDGTGPNTNDDPTPLILPTSSINAVKEVSTATPPVNNGDGTFNVTYDLIVQNTGTITLGTIVFTDIPDADLAAATVSTVIEPNITGGSATANPLTGIYPMLFTGGGTLAPGETVNVSYVLQVNPTLAADPASMTNQANVTAEDPAGVVGTIVAQDNSDSGADPTNDNPGAPGNGTGLNPNDDPTPLALAGDLNSILLSKRASRNEVSIGEVVQYTLELQNQQTTNIIDADVIDNIPGGFQFASDSGIIIRAGADNEIDTADDVTTAIVPTGNDPITFNDVDLAAGETVLIRYLLRVTTGVVEGDYTNTAQTFGVTSSAISNDAKATVRVVQDPILQKTTIIGKVFADINEDGWQDEGEYGLPGVRIATVEGLIIETDQYGRFHLADVDGGRWERGRNYIMKVDVATLPEGSEFTTENPRVLRITQSLMSKFNFGVKLPPQQLMQKALEMLSSKEVIEVKTLSNIVEAVRFESGKSDIPTSYHESLQRVVDLLSGKDVVSVEVIGHTDTDGLSSNAAAIYRDNYGLSNARAEEVANEIQKLLNISADKFETKGFGPDKPAATNATEEGKQQNRRVVVRETHEEKVYQETSKQQVVNRQATLPNGGQVWAIEDPSKQDPRLDVLFHEAIVVSDGKAQEPIHFSLYSNYLAFIDRWQVEIYRDNNVDIVNPIAVIKGNATDLNRTHEWNASELSARDISEPALWYVLRVFDSQGRQDATFAKRLAITSDAIPGVGLQEEIDHEALARSIYAQSSLDMQSIPIQGSRVRVNGRNIESGKLLLINSVVVPVSETGTFVHEQHMPIGEHALNIQLLDDAQNNEKIERELAVKVDGKYMFLVGLANLTVGDNNVGGNVEALGDDDHFDEDVWVDGRLAFYLKGKVKGKYLITAQLDTTEAELNDLHDRIDDEDPTAIFRQLDPDKYYSVYGDDSTTIDDTDSQGNIYLRVDWDKSNALWGNYNTDLTGTEFAQYNRSLYGAKLEHRSLNTNKYGDHKQELHAFASEAQTAGAHNSFNATGGSLYYLRDTEVVQGSEKIWVEIRSRDTEQVVESFVLEHGQDYDIDYLQGRVILSRPLTQIDLGSGPSIIKDAPLEGNDVYLLADYEYRPDAFEADDLTVGARGKAWINDFIAVGGTYVDEEREGVDYELKGADVTLRAAKGTYLKFEYAESDAQQAASSFASANGGISFNSFNQQTLAGNTDTDGEAVGIEGRINLSEFTENEEGFVMAWYKDRDQGFSSVSRLDDGIETTDVGLHAEWQASNALQLSTKITNLDKDDLTEELNASVQADYGLTDKLSLGAEIRYEDIDDQTAADLDGDAVLGGLAMSYKVSEQTNIYTSGQAVLNDSGDYESNALATVGINKQVNYKLALKGEVSTGDRGDAVILGGEYAITPNMNLSLNAGFGSGAATSVGTNYTTSNGLELYGSYAVDPDRTDGGNNMFTFGSRRQYQNGLSIYSESQFGEGDDEQSAARTYGLDFDLTDQWRLSASMQTNDLDRDSGDIDRRSATLGASYKGKTMKFGSVLEYREDDDKALNSDNTQWVTSNTVEWQKSESLKLLGKLDLSTTHSDISKNDEGKYVELDLGFAYRPTGNDRLNILGKYTFLYDLAVTGQDTAQPDERSHIFAVEAIYDLNNQWELGGKLAYKAGDTRLQRGSGPWFETGAHLAVARARYHVIKNWDALMEYRWLESETEDDEKHGALAALYRHVGQHMKVGVGYNFTDFNDDLTDNDYDSDGWFIDIVGKY